MAIKMVHLQSLSIALNFFMKTIEPFIENQEERVERSVRELRKRNFSHNLPFLILSENLPEGQAFREFPDGRIELQELVDPDTSYAFKVIKILDPKEADRIRSDHGLY